MAQPRRTLGWGNPKSDVLFCFCLPAKPDIIVAIHAYHWQLLSPCVRACFRPRPGTTNQGPRTWNPKITRNRQPKTMNQERNQQQEPRTKNQELGTKTTKTIQIYDESERVPIWNPVREHHFETSWIEQVSTLHGKGFPRHSRPAT